MSETPLHLLPFPQSLRDDGASSAWPDVLVCASLPPAWHRASRPLGPWLDQRSRGSARHWKIAAPGEDPLIRFIADPALGTPEGYHLESTPTGIEIRARVAAGD